MTATTLPPREVDATLEGRLASLAKDSGAALVAALQALPAAARALLAVAAAGLGVVGSILAWGTYAGFPGKMTLLLFNAYPGGARLYTLVLSVTALLALLPLRGRRSAGLALMTGLVLTTGQTLWAIAADGNAITTVAAGAWITLAAGVVGLAAFAALPADTPVGPPPVLPLPADVVVLAVGYGLGLGLLVYVLDLAAANQFLGLLLTLVAVGVALGRLGAIAVLTSAAGRRQPVSYAFLGVVALAFPLTQDGDQHWIGVLAQAAIFAGAAMGLNVVVGLAGLLDLGYVAFFGVGGYVAAEFGGRTLQSIGPSHGHVPYLLVIPLAALVAGAVGVAVGAPTLRLRGDYLAIVTLGFGEIFQQVVNNSGFSGSSQGISGIPQIGVGSFSFGDKHTLFGTTLPYLSNYYYGGLLLIVAVMFVFARLNDSRIGRAWVAIREDELAAAATGINTTALKLLAFGIGAVLAGAAGSLSAHESGAITSDQFSFQNSALLLAAVVLGGMGSTTGTVVGSLLLFVIPEKFVPFGDYRLLLFGVALVLMMLFRPQGIVVNRRRAREFADPGGADALSAPPGGVL